MVRKTTHTTDRTTTKATKAAARRVFDIDVKARQ
jgi:hypothetical protein